MAEKVQSFKDGGALWFTDLTTPDAMYILPVLTALTFWITVEVSHFFYIYFHVASCPNQSTCQCGVIFISVFSVAVLVFVQMLSYHNQSTMYLDTVKPS